MSPVLQWIMFVFLLWFSSFLLLSRFQNQCWKPVHCTYQMNPCTLIKICSMLYTNFLAWSKNLLCSPEFVPQIVGGALFPGVVTLKISVWHCPFSNILLPPILVTDVVARISTMLHISFETIFNFCSKLTRIWLIDDESIKIQTNLANVITTWANFQPTLASSYSSWRNKITAIFIGGLTTSIFNWKDMLLDSYEVTNICNYR